MTSSRAIKAGQAFIELTLRNEKMLAGLRRAQRRLRAFGRNITSIGARFTAVGLAAATGLALPLRIFAAFDDKMRLVRAVTGATEDQFAALREEAKRLGRSTSFSASQVADAMAELGRAGFNPQEILNATEGVLNLSRATGTELPRAAEIAGAALRGFSLDTTEMDRVVDVLTATANKSAQTLEDLFEGLKPVAPLAAAAGASIESTAASLGLLANAGIKGSLAGNALARAYKNLSTTKTQGELKALGVTAVDAAGNLRPMPDILADLNHATQNMGSAQRLAAFDSLFGRGQAAALKLAEASGEAFDTLLKDIQSAGGIAARTAEEMDAGIGGAFRRLMSAAEGVAISIGEAIEKPVRRLADLMSTAAGWIDLVVQKNGDLIRTILKVAAIVLAAGVALLTVGIGFMVLGGAIGGIVTVLGAAGAALSFILSIIGAIVSPIGLAIAAFIGLAAVILEATGASAAILEWLGDRFRALRDGVEEVVGGIVDALAAGDIKLAARILWLGLKAAWQAGVAELKKIWLTLKSYILSVGVTLWSSYQRIVETTAHGITVAWVETTSFLSRLWTNFIAGFQTAWALGVGFVRKRLAEIRGFFDSSFDVTAAKEQIDLDIQDRLIEIEDGLQDKLGSIEDDRQFKRDYAAEGHDDALNEIAERDEAAQQGIFEKAFADVAATEAELAAAQEELKAAIEAARKAREDRDAGAGDEPAPGLPKLEDLVNRLKNAGAGVGGGNLSVRGTFNASAIPGLAAASNAQERTAKAAESLDKSVRRLSRRITDSGGLTFT